MEVPITASLQAAMEIPISASLGPMGPLLRQLHSLTSRPEGVSEGEIQSLKEDLGGLCTYLMDLSEAEDPSLTAKCWMREVRELCYDTKDYFDEAVHSGASEDAKTEFEILADRARSASERRERYKVDPQTFDKRTFLPVGRRLPALHADLIDHGPMDELANFLLGTDKEKQRKVASIVGPEGVGKTTLAKRLYRKIGSQFDCRAFLRVSPNTDMRRLLTSMFIQIQRQQPPCSLDAQQLSDNIAEHLRDKRYFIIIDDLWDISVWDIISGAFPDGDCCSRIIITTQIDDAALACCSYQSDYIFKMRPLNYGQSRKLFFNRVFGSEGAGGCPQDFKEVSYGTIMKCGGFPLAIENIASLLASEPDLVMKKWKHIQDSLSSTLKKNPTSEVMKEVLNLIYNNLPPHLKTCLLYLRMYPEDYTIGKDDLVKQWVAEGLVGVVERQNTEEIAGGYFDDLVNGGMIQPVDTNNNGDVLSCTVHHMVLDLIANKSKEENFITTVHCFQSTIVLDKVRRLSVQFGGAKSAKIPESIRTSQVRSLLFCGFFKCVPSTADYGLLRVLILHIWADEDKIFDLTRIGELFRLRYLKIECNITVKLPGKIGGLQYLGTLTVDARLSAVPSDIVHLERLLHLRLPSGSNLPHGVGHMTSLRTLGYFDLGNNSEDNVMDLGKLTNLQDLQLTCSTVQPAENLEKNMQLLGSILENLSILQSVTLVPASSSHVNTLDGAGASSMSISCDVLSSVSPAPALLERLELLPRIFIFPSLPKWFQELRKLCILKIAVRELSREDICILKALPALTALSLYVQTAPAERIIFSKTGFSVLRYFKFRCSAPWLTFEADAMRNLEKLELCFNAHEAHQDGTAPISIEHLPGLKEISAKIAGAVADAASILTAAVSSDPRNPDVQLVGPTFYGMAIQEQEHRTPEEQYETLEEDPDEYCGTQDEESGQDENTQAGGMVTQGQEHGIPEELDEMLEDLEEYDGAQAEGSQEDENKQAHIRISAPSESSSHLPVPDEYCGIQYEDSGQGTGMAPREKVHMTLEQQGDIQEEDPDESQGEIQEEDPDESYRTQDDDKGEDEKTQDDSRISMFPESSSRLPIPELKEDEDAMVSASTGAVNSIQSKLTTLMGEEYANLRGTREEVTILTLKDELGAMNALLDQLADMAELNMEMKNLTNRMRDITYDVEDCIDDLMLHFAKNIHRAMTENPEKWDVLLEFVYQTRNLTAQGRKADLRNMVRTTEMPTLGSSYMATASGLQTLVSYSDLPRHMKSCLLYLSVFPENHVIRKDRLIWRWIAEGFLPKRSEQSWWETGESCFEELIARNLIEPVYNEGKDDEVPMGCKVDGLILEFITALSNEKNFVTTDAEATCVQHDVIRRLAVSYSNKRKYDTFGPRTKHLSNKDEADTLASSSVHLSRVRSLTVSGDVEGMRALTAFKLIRVLDLEDAKYLTADHLEGIGVLVLLRYLGLRGTGVHRLPEDIGELQHLQTLDLTRTRVTRLPASISRLRKLVSLLGDGLCFSYDNADHPQTFNDLEELSIIDVTESSFPAKKKDVTESSSHDVLELLVRSKRLRMLGVRTNYNRTYQPASPGVLSFLDELRKCNLESLIIHGNIKELNYWAPGPTLRRFQLRKFLPRVPEGWASLDNLTHLDIRIVEINAEDLHVLKNLGNLILLKLYSGGYDGSVQIAKKPAFGSLEVAWFICLGGGMGLKFGMGAMPKLRRLRLDFNVGETRRLSGNEFDFGIQFPSSLQQVRVTISCIGSTRTEVDAAELAIRDQISRNPKTPSLVLVKEYESSMRNEGQQSSTRKLHKDKAGASSF